MDTNTDLPQPEESHTPEDSDHTQVPKGNPITLQVGERRFVTFPSTLTTESPYFACLLSDRWHYVQADGSYFVDADGDLFVYILRYLRSGVLPIFYSSLAGHDYSKYHALIGEAEYFGIERLMDWLRDKKYEKMVKIAHSVEDYQELDEMAKTYDSNVQLEYYPTRKMEKVYVCPRGIYVHRGNPSACGRQCQRARGDEDVFEDEEVLKTVVIKKKLILDHSRGLDPTKQ